MATKGNKLEYHLIGNGKSAGLYKTPKTGKVYTCNLPPFAVPEAVATFMVDFKMMNAIHSGEVQVPGEWIVGARPKKWAEAVPSFYLKYAPQIKEFFLDIPKYAGSYTNFSCGHMGVYYLIKRKDAKIIHMYGFDSIFDFDLYSSTDFYLSSDRGVVNNGRLTGNWRPIWTEMFKEFKDVEFKLHYTKNCPKIPLPENVEVVIK